MLIYLLEKYPNKNWDFDELSRNPNIPLDYVLNHPECKWNYVTIFENPNMNEEYFEIFQKKYPNNSIQYSYNSNIDFNIILKYVNNWDIRPISQNNYITMDLIQEHQELDWNYLWMSCNENLSIDFIKENMDKNWDFESLTMFQPLHIIKKNKDLDWVYDLLSYNHTLNYDYLKNYKKNVVFDYDSINENMDINELFLLLNSDDILINKYFLSRNKNLKEEDINKFGGLNYEWNFKDLSYHKNINMDYINKNKKYNWCYSNISKNPNITLYYIEKNIDKIDFSELSKNKLDYIQLEYHNEKKYHSIYKTKKIEEELIQKTWNPDRFMNWCLSIDDLIYI